MQVAKNLWWIVMAAIVAVFAFTIFANVSSEDRRGPSASIGE